MNVKIGVTPMTYNLLVQPSSSGGPDATPESAPAPLPASERGAFARLASTNDAETTDSPANNLSGDNPASNQFNAGEGGPSLTATGPTPLAEATVAATADVALPASLATGLAAQGDTVISSSFSLIAAGTPTGALTGPAPTSEGLSINLALGGGKTPAGTPAALNTAGGIATGALTTTAAGASQNVAAPIVLAGVTSAASSALKEAPIADSKQLAAIAAKAERGTTPSTAAVSAPLTAAAKPQSNVISTATPTSEGTPSLLTAPTKTVTGTGTAARHTDAIPVTYGVATSGAATSPKLVPLQAAEFSSPLGSPLLNTSIEASTVLTDGQINTVGGRTIAQAATQSAGAVPPAIHQVADAIQLRKSERSISIRLDPPDLGTVTIDLSFDKSRLVLATLSAENADTSSLLKRHSDALQRELLDSGFGEVSVEHGQHDQNAEFQQNFAGLNLYAQDGPLETAAPVAELGSSTYVLTDDHIDIRL